MTADKIFYNDLQHHVTVTDSTFIVKKKRYSISRIRNHFIKEIKPVMLPVVIMLLSGPFLIVMGALRKVSLFFIPDITIGNLTINEYGWTVAAGVLIFFGGVAMIRSMKPQYALCISTDEEGEDDVIVSTKRAYIKQIIDALNRAFMLTKN